MAPPMERSPIEGVGADGCDGLVVNDRLRLVGTLERTDGVEPLEPMDGDDRLTDGLGRVAEIRGEGVEFTEDRGLGETDLGALGDRVTVLLLDGLDLGAELNDREGDGLARLTLGEREGVLAGADGLEARPLGLDREPSPPEPLRPPGWPRAGNPPSSVIPIKAAIITVLAT